MLLDEMEIGRILLILECPEYMCVRMVLLKCTRKNWSFLKSIFQIGCRIFSIRRKKQVLMVSDVKSFKLYCKSVFYILQKCRFKKYRNSTFSRG